MAELQKAISEICDKHLQTRGKAVLWGGKLALLGLALVVMGGTLGLACDSNFFVAMFLLGLPTSGIGLAVWADARGEQPIISFWRRVLLLSTAEGLERSNSISGSEYGKFLITFERLKRQSMLSVEEHDKVIVTLNDLMLKKGRRISGLDYVELEKELLRAGTVKVNDKSVGLFSRLHIERILEDYERLREEIRDRRLTEPKTNSKFLTFHSNSRGGSP